MKTSSVLQKQRNTMSDRPPMMTVEERTIAADQKLEVEFTMSSPGPPAPRVDRFVDSCCESVEHACKVALNVRLQWLYGGSFTSAVLFDRSFLQLGPSSIPDYANFRTVQIESAWNSLELLTETSCPQVSSISFQADQTASLYVRSPKMIIPINVMPRLMVPRTFANHFLPGMRDLRW